jgi:hypothetical protein
MSPGTAASSTATGNPITVTLAEVSPPSADSSTISVRGTLATSVTGPLTGLTMSLEVGTKPVGSRGELATLTANTATARARDYRALPLAGGAPAQALTSPPTAGASPVPFEVTGELGASATTGVRVLPLRVRVSGSVAGRAVAPIGAAYTFVVRSFGQPGRTPVAVVLPLADQPRLRSDGLLTDNTLADEVKPDGRLATLLAAAAAHPSTTLAVDPTLVQTLQRMARPEGYDYASPGGRIHAPADPNAAALLSGVVQFADAGGTVIPLPYGDADLTALVRAQKLDTVKYAVNTGEVVLAALLHRTARQSGFESYPADGLADTTTVDVLRRLEVGTVLLDDRLLAPSRSVRYTPSAVVDLATSAGPIRALAADHRLADLVTSPTGGAGASGAGAQLARFRAELGMITAERAESRPQVIALPRNWTPSGDWASQVLGAVDSDYAQPVALGALTTPGLPSAPRGPLVYPADARSRELPASYLEAVASVRAEAQALGPVLCPPQRATGTCQRDRVDPMTNALVTAASIWWRGDRMVNGVSLSQQVDGDVSGIRNGIRVVASRSVALTSRHGVVPITLENNTPFEVTVVLAFSSTTRSRLKSAVRETHTLQPGQKAQIEIEVSAEGAGTFPIEIRRLNLDGQPLSTAPPTRVLVRSTVYGAIATGITIVAVSLLVLAVLLRLARRLRPSARRAAATAKEAPEAAARAGKGTSVADRTGPVAVAAASGQDSPPSYDDAAGPQPPARRWLPAAAAAGPGYRNQHHDQAEPVYGQEPADRWDHGRGWEHDQEAPTYQDGRFGRTTGGPAPDRSGQVGRDGPAGHGTRRRRSGP